VGLALWALLVVVVSAGEAPKPEAEKKDAAANAEAPKPPGEWQARISSKILEWSGQTDLDYGFALAYHRDPSHPSSVVGPWEDGRGIADPAAFLNFPSQSTMDLGLRIFLDQMDAKNGALEMVVEALEQYGDVQMLAEPEVTLKKGASKAMISTESRIPYATEQIVGVGLAMVTLFQDTGVVLNVMFNDVVELDDRYAHLGVTASVTSLAGFVAVEVDSKGNPSQVPQVNTRRIENNVLVRDKTTLITGILKEDAELSNARRPPIIGDIPIIKELWPNRSSSVRTHEILFLLHVDLIPPGAL
jgi:type II secretory pathway component GspD/PulD (secretin)